MALFFPTLYRRRITDVTAGDLRQLGVSGLLLDVDNTLTTHDNPEVAPQVLEWLRQRRAEGLRLVVVSNNKPERVAPFARQLELPFQANAGKPLPRGYRAAAAHLGLPPEPHKIPTEIHVGKRIGIDYAQEAIDFPWRFYVTE